MALIRGLDAAFAAAITGASFYPVVMVYLDWPSGAVYAHSGAGNIAFEGQTWVGVGEFGRIDVPAEAFGIGIPEAVISLTGLAPDVLEFIDDPVRNRRARILFGATTEPGGNTLIGDPVQVFRGTADSVRFGMQGQDGEITVEVQVTLRVGPPARAVASVVHTAEDQEYHHPGDTAGRHLINIERRTETIKWPAG